MKVAERLPCTTAAIPFPLPPTSAFFACYVTDRVPQAGRTSMTQRALWQRLLIHTILTAVLLALVGWFLVQLAAIALNQNHLSGPPAVSEDHLPSQDPQDRHSPQDLLAALQWQLPLRLAVLGVVLVLLGEGLLILFRRSSSCPARPQQASRSISSASASRPPAESPTSSSLPS